MRNKRCRALSAAVATVVLFPSPGRANVTVYDNLPAASETVFTTGSAPRTTGADDITLTDNNVTLLAMRLGYTVTTAIACDAHVRLWNTMDLNAATGPIMAGTLADFIVPLGA